MSVFDFVPTVFLSRFAGWAAGLGFPAPIGRFILQSYCRFYGIDAGAAARPLAEFRSLADFFVRDIKPGLRPVGEGLISPVDGMLRTFGPVRNGLLEQIKGMDYRLENFLADRQLAQRFMNGFYLNFYLSPADCHHVFSPLEGQIRSARWIPGRLLPVNDRSVAQVPGLFCRNERLLTLLDTRLGEVLVAMVGATCVGGLEAAYDGEILSLAGSAVSAFKREYDGIKIGRGEKLGTFRLGSSVVLLFSVPEIRLDSSLQPGMRVNYGEGLSAC